MSHDRGHNLLQLLLQYWTIDSLSLFVNSLWPLMTVSDRAHCEKWLRTITVDDKNTAKATAHFCIQTRWVCLCVCLTCDPEATLAAYGSNWAASKLTKCQWSVVPQEVINCEPRGQWERSVSIHFLPRTVSAWTFLSAIYYDLLK